MIKKQRECGIDLLRICGLFCIILAHVHPPVLINQIRNFDVPLMVIVAGLSLSASHTYNLTFGKYLKKRALRLVIPVWTFLTIFFSFTFLQFMFLKQPFPFSFVEIKNSFMLLNGNGIGYVWIFRIFLLVSLTSGILNLLNNKVKNNINYFGVLLILWLVHELLLYYFKLQIYTFPITNILIDNFLLNILPYSIFFGIGVRLPKLSTKYLILCSFFLFVAFLFFSTYLFIQNGHFTLTQNFKYPPQFYYASYSVFISVLLYLFVFKMNFFNLFKQKHFTTIIIFLSTSSMWIYLWHIFVLYNLVWAGHKLPNFFNNYISHFFIVACLAVILTFLQKKLFGFLLRYFHHETWCKKTIKVCFLS